jgi:hypothetical protein
VMPSAYLSPPGQPRAWQSATLVIAPIAAPAVTGNCWPAIDAQTSFLSRCIQLWVVPTARRGGAHAIRSCAAVMVPWSAVLPCLECSAIQNRRPAWGCSSAGRAPALQFACDMRCARRCFPWSHSTVSGAVMCSN